MVNLERGERRDAPRGHLRLCDNWNFNSGNPVVYAGGNYNQNSNHGMFYLNYTSATNSSADHGCRVLLAKAKATPREYPQVAAHPLVKMSLIGTGLVHPQGRWNARRAKRRGLP